MLYEGQTRNNKQRKTDRVPAILQGLFVTGCKKFIELHVTGERKRVASCNGRRTMKEVILRWEESRHTDVQLD